MQRAVVLGFVESIYEVIWSSGHLGKPVSDLLLRY